jgi:hypothetical protein
VPITSNIDDVDRAITGTLYRFGMTSQSKQRNLGEDLAHGVADGIEVRSDQQQRGEVVIWPENSDNPPGKGYKSRKKRLYGTDKTNYRTSQMLSHESLVGELLVDRNEVKMTYGTDRAPTTSANGYIEERDKRVTDREKAAYAHEDGKDRDFYELDEQIVDERIMPLIEDALQEAFDQAFR